jgi:glycosylphosphatidylinositol phospholipase D
MINGVAAGDVTGRSVSDAGDLNGDGVADLLLGAPQANQNDAEEARGVGYVVFGRDTATDGAFPASIELSALDGTNGFALDGAAFGDQAGNAVSSAGDLNSDGIDDLVIASPGSSFSSVLFGRDTAVEDDFPARVALGPGALDGTNGFSLEGVSATSVSQARDVNGDGIADLILGAEDASPNGAASGAGYVVFGKDAAVEGNFPAVFELSNLDGSNGFVINGVAAGNHAGRSVSGAGDINHDGIADLLIGATGADANGEDAGAAYVVFGKDTGSVGDFPASLELSVLNGSNGFVLNGEQAGDAAGLAVSGAGDVNADGIDDLLLGSPDADPNGDRSGRAYVVFGRDTQTDGDFPASIELSALDGTNGFAMNGEGVRVAGDRAGFSVSGIDDINADGLADVLIGAIGANRSYVVYGVDTEDDGDFPASVELSELDGRTGFALHGVNAGDGAGRVSGAGDNNHDGAMDLLIGAPGADPNGTSSGAGYVIYGLVSDDADQDGIADDRDNCILQANGPLKPDAGGFSQRDTDADGYGNSCDPDFDNSGNVDFADLAYLKSVFFTPDVDADLNGDGKVDFADLAIQKSLFFQPPGPSGLVP